MTFRSKARVAHMDPAEYQLDDSEVERILNAADIVTMARSALERDYRGCDGELIRTANGPIHWSAGAYVTSSLPPTTYRPRNAPSSRHTVWKNRNDVRENPSRR